MAKLTATETARDFSAVLNRAASGEEIEITRNGATVAVIGPPKVKMLSADRFRELISTAPPVDVEFAGDLREIRESVGPPESPWLS